MGTIEIKIKKLDERAVIPSYAHDGDVCMDLTAIDVEYDENNDMYIYHTGLAFESDKNIGQFLLLRSSNCKTDCYLCNQVGVADSAIYRGEIQFRMKLRDSIDTIAEREGLKQFFFSINMTKQLVGKVDANSIPISMDVYEMEKKNIRERARNLEFAPYKVGDRIGQMVFLQYPTVKLIETDSLSDTVRGDGGFGSTGN